MSNQEPTSLEDGAPTSALLRLALGNVERAIVRGTAELQHLEDTAAVLREALRRETGEHEEPEQQETIRAIREVGTKSAGLPE